MKKLVLEKLSWERLVYLAQLKDKKELVLIFTHENY